MDPRTGPSRNAINRRRFLITSALSAGASTFGGVSLLANSLEQAGWSIHEVTTSVRLESSQQPARVWVPMPLPATPFQRLLFTDIECNGHATHLRNSAAPMVNATFAAGATPALTVTCRLATRDWTVDLEQPHRSTRRNSDQATYLAATSYVPTDGIVRQRAQQITQGQTSDLAKTRAIYAWIIANTYRAPRVRGCGVGSIRPMLESGDLGGKCADLNGLFVGLLRACGVPARDAYGVRVGPSHFAESSCLGVKGADATKSQHCRAEVYLQEFGWVPMDPADVRKVILEEPPGQLAPSDERVAATSKRLFGGWEGNWIAYNYAQDVTLPNSGGSPLHFLMYPQAEVAGERLDPYSPTDFRYEITTRLLSS